MLFKVIKKEPIDFAVLGGILLVSLLAFSQFSYDMVLKERVILATGAAYFLWGIFHHWKRKDLCLLIAIEYFLLATFGALITIFVLLRG